MEGVRGTGGGYILARAPGEITLAELFAALEGSTALVVCVDRPATCRQADDCVTRRLWIELKEASDSILRRRTLQDLVNQRAAE